MSTGCENFSKTQRKILINLCDQLNEVRKDYKFGYRLIPNQFDVMIYKVDYKYRSILQYSDTNLIAIIGSLDNILPSSSDDPAIIMDRSIEDVFERVKDVLERMMPRDFRKEYNRIQAIIGLSRNT